MGLFGYGSAGGTIIRLGRTSSGAIIGFGRTGGCAKIRLRRTGSGTIAYGFFDTFVRVLVHTTVNIPHLINIEVGDGSFF